MIYDRKAYKITIGIGQRANGTEISENSARWLTDTVLKDAGKAFGGATVQHGEGVWIEPDGKLTRESVIIITILVDYAAVRHPAAEIHAFAQDAGLLFEQHSVCVESQGRGYITEIVY